MADVSLPPHRPAEPAGSEPPAALRYGAAAACVGAALALSLLFPAFVAPNVFIFFFAAVIVAAWYGGPGPALLAVALALPLVNWFVLAPRAAWSLSPESLERVAIFTALSLLIGAMRRSLTAARQRAEVAAREAELRAVQLEDQTMELEQQAAELQEQATELEFRTEEAQNLAAELEDAYRRLEETMQRQLAEAQALAHVGSWEWLVAADRVTWSDEMYRLYGMQPGEARVDFAAFLERVHPDDREAMRAAVLHSRETGEPFELDHRAVLADGRVRVLHARGRTERAPDGRVARMVGTGQDVTEARATEETARAVAAERAARTAAEEGRARLESVLEGIGESFLALDGEWRCTWANARAERGIGLPRGELVGRDIRQVLPELSATPVWEAARAVRADGRPRAVEFESPRARRWFAVRLAPWEGGVSVFYGDVTERRRAQEERARLAAIVEGSEDAIFAKSLDGVILSWNRGAERLYGYAPEEVIGRPVTMLAPPDRADEIPAILARLAAGEAVASHETVRRRKDGTLLDVLLSISPIRDADGRVTAASTIARDITDRKRWEAALRASEGRYRRIVDTAEEGIWLLDAAGVTTYVNERMAAMLGRPAQAIAGRPFADFVHPEHRAEAAGHLARPRAGSPERHDLRLVRADGGELWALVSLGAVLDDAGAWTGALAMVTDVTDRHRAEESLRFLADAGRVLARSLDRERVLRELAALLVPRLADLAVVLLDADGQPPIVHVAHRDPARLPTLRAAMGSGLAQPEPDGFLARARRAGGPLLVAEVTPETLAEHVHNPDTLRLCRELDPRSLLAVPLQLEDRPVGVMLLACEGSGRRYGPAELPLMDELARRAAAAAENARLHAAERDARRAAERSAGWIARLQSVTAALSEARTPEDVGDAVLSQTLAAMGATAGWVGQLDPSGTRVDLVTSTGFERAVVEEFRSVPLEMPISLTEAVRTGAIVCIESREEMERRYPGVADSGQRGRFAAWAVAPLWVEGRPVGGLVLNFPQPRGFDDDTRDYLLAVGRQSALALERARLYDAERRARAEAEEANRAKFEFLTTMSHELRTPLNAIAGYVDLLELGIRGPLTPEQRGDLARIRRSQTHLLGLINDVLNFARIETGHVNFALRDLAADEVMAEVEPLIAPQVQARGLAYTHESCDPAPVLLADPEKLRQILLNLLSNAVKFTPAGGRITLACDEADGAVRFRVADTGIGIPQDKLSSIFEPFVQVNAGYTRTSEGTGLGLSISRDLARAMGGELTAESVEGEGSVFTLTLPRGGASPE